MNRGILVLILVCMFNVLAFGELTEPSSGGYPVPSDQNDEATPEIADMTAAPAQPASAAAEQKITLDLKGVDILTVLKMLSQKGNLKIIAGKDVHGAVTIFLEDVDVRKALDMILELNDLAYEEEDGIIKILTAQEYERKYGKKYADKRQMKIIPLQAARADEIIPILTRVKSTVGEIIPNPKSNSIILFDLPEAVQKMEEIIRETDQNERQVLIEAKIVQVMLNDQYKVGVDWKQVFTKINGIGDPASGNIEANLGPLVAKGASGIRGEIQVGAVGKDNYNVVVSALESVGKTNLLSSPRISVLNNKEARILVGTKDAYVTTTVVTSGTSGNVTAENITYIDVGVKLFVTPVIGRDGFITLKIRPEVSSVYDYLETATGNKIPKIRTSETETTVTVKDGVTLILGGLIETKDENTRTIVPLVGKVPIVGNLFGGVDNNKTKSELVIFLTPHIVSGSEDVVEPRSSIK